MLNKSDLTKLQSIFVTKDEFFTRLDQVIGELRAIREDMGAMLYRQREHSEMLEKHEEQLTVIKTKLA